MKTKAYIFDIDNTIADCSHRLHLINREEKDWDLFYELCKYDKPILDTINLLKILISQNITILFVTGRPERVGKQTELWLMENLDYKMSVDSQIKMRKDNDYRPDYIIKKEIYENEIKDNYDIIGVFEDRNSCVKMYRELGLTCFQVRDGNY